MNAPAATDAVLRVKLGVVKVNEFNSLVHLRTAPVTALTEYILIGNTGSFIKFGNQLVFL